MASDDWYYVKDGKSCPPVHWNVLVTMARAGKLTANDQIWNESLPRWVSAGSVEGLIPGRGGTSYGYTPDTVYEAAPLRKSWLGVISLLMGIFFCLVEVVMLSLATLAGSKSSGAADNSSESALLGLILLGGGMGAFLGAILGLVAMFQESANKIAAAFGIALNGMCVIGVVVLLIIGMMMG